MVNGSRNMDLMLNGQRPYLDKTRLDLRRKKMRNHPKSPKIKFLHAFIVLRRDTLLKYAFPERNQKDKK